MGRLSRRQLLARAIAAGSSATLAELLGPARFLSAVDAATPATARATIPGNPLVVMPDRGWERVYRDQYSDDSTFVFTCAPNDTHNCLLRAHVKNGVIVRISPTYGYGKATDLYGNQASHRWDPRICQKGLILSRRFYGEVSAVIRAVLNHLVLRRSWDTISRRNGLAVLTDHIHLRPRAAAVVADLITEFLEASPEATGV